MTVAMDTGFKGYLPYKAYLSLRVLSVILVYSCQTSFLKRQRSQSVDIESHFLVFLSISNSVFASSCI
jgi:hypothetical protein